MAYGPVLGELTFVGMMAIHDPLRPGVDRAVRKLLANGVAVKMLTGDSEATAKAVGLKTKLVSTQKPVYT